MEGRKTENEDKGNKRMKERRGERGIKEGGEMMYIKDSSYILLV